MTKVILMPTKKLIVSFILMLISSIAFSQANKWVVFPYIVDFAQDTPEVTELPNTSEGGGYSDGIFDGNGNLVFYMTGNGIYDSDGNNIKEINKLDAVEAAIVKKPGTDNVYYVIYNHTEPMYDLYYHYCEVTITPEGVIAGTEIHIKNGADFGGNYGRFAVSPPSLYNGNQYLYITGYGFIERYSITNSGIEYVQTYNHDLHDDPSELELSYDGSKLMWVSIWQKTIALFDIGSSGEIISNSIINLQSHISEELFGGEFSLLEDKIFLATKNSLYEYSISANQISQIFNSENLITSHLEYCNGYFYGQISNGYTEENFFKINPYTSEITENVITGYDFQNSNGGGVKTLPDKLDEYTSYVTSVVSGNWSGNGSVTVSTYLSNLPYTFNFIHNNGVSDIRGGTYGENTFDEIVAGTYDIEVTDTDGNSTTIENVIVGGVYNYAGVSTITEDTDWTGEDYNYNINEQINIENGATLTITNCEIGFGKDGGFEIGQNAKLILDNSTLSNVCEDTWAGIEVYEGDLIIINNCTIANADVFVDGLLELTESSILNIPGNTHLYVRDNRIVELGKYSQIIIGNDGLFYFDQWAGIIGKEESKVIVDYGGTLETYSFSDFESFDDDLWDGFEIHGTLLMYGTCYFKNSKINIDGGLLELRQMEFDDYNDAGRLHLSEDALLYTQNSGEIVLGVGTIISVHP